MNAERHSPLAAAPIHALIVDDEPLARAELRRLLAAHPGIVPVGEAAGVEEALRLCQAAQRAGSPIQLLWLDVEMPDGSGFDLLERLWPAPDTVFVTAYDRYAVRAFRTQALDYLVKPVDPRDLAQTVQRLLARRAAQSGGAPDRLFVKDGARAALIRIGEIRSIEAAGDYARILYGADGASILSGRSLAALEGLLPETAFFRVSRQCVVALDHVAAVDVGEGGRLILHLDCGAKVPVSERRSQAFRERFG
jgi:two-component system, LytTR family, response regulator